MCLAVPGKVIEIYQANGARMGKVDFGGVVREACLDFLPEIEVGDYTIVHVGFGISRLDEEEARQTLEMFQAIEGQSEDEDAAPGRELPGSPRANQAAAG